MAGDRCEVPPLGLSHGSMQVISFKHTRLWKRGIRVSAMAVIVSVTTPWVLDGSFQRDPITHVIPLCILAGFVVYFLWRMQLHRLADEVVDCEDRLEVRRGQTEENIPFSNVSMADVSTSGGIHRITVRLREPTKFGVQFEFLPRASLWSNLSGITRVAAGLTDRAISAKSGREGR